MKKETQKEKLKRAFDILNRIEYSSDGFVKRYPEEAEYKEAMKALGEVVSSGDKAAYALTSTTALPYSGPAKIRKSPIKNRAIEKP